MWNPTGCEPHRAGGVAASEEEMEAAAAAATPPRPGRRRREDAGESQMVGSSGCSLYTLTGLSLLFGAVTVVTLALAVATDCWLFMSEPYQLTAQEMRDLNITEPIQTDIVVHVRTGLWRVCTTNLMNGTFPDQCIAIDYQQKGSGRLEGAPTCMTIVGSIRVSSPLMVTGLVLTLTAVVMSIVGSVRHSGKTVIAAILYVLTGLCIAVGIILYISAINDEVGYRTQTKGKSRDFQYYYGWSFFLAAGDFVLAEIAAVLNVTLYLRHNSRVSDMVRIIPGLEDKLQTSSFRLEADALDTRGRGDVW